MLPADGPVPGGRAAASALPDIAAATDGWSRYRKRRYGRAVLAGVAPLPADIYRSLAEGTGELHIGGKVLYSPPGVTGSVTRR